MATSRPRIRTVERKRARSGKAYQVVWYDPQRGKETGKVFTHRTDAQAWMDTELLPGLAGGHYRDPRGGQVTFDAWVGEWLDRRMVRPRTETKTAQHLTHILPFFGHMPLGQVTQAHVQKWVKQTRDAGAAPSSVASYYATVRMIFKAAVEEDLLGRSPCRNIQLPPNEADERVFLDYDQAQRLVAATRPWCQSIIATALGTGLRWGELAGLKRSRVDLTHMELHVVQELCEEGGKLWFDDVKSRGSRRVVPIPESTGRVLEARLKMPPGPEGVVFYGQRRGLLRKAFRERELLPAVERAGLEVRPTFHDLRHTYAAWLIAAGTDPFEIQRRMGHGSISVTYDIYGHRLKRQVTDRATVALDEQLRLLPSPTADNVVVLAARQSG